MDIAGFFLVLGISARLTRLVTHDALLDPLRKRAGTGWLGFLVQCPWCVGLWISAAVTGLYAVVPVVAMQWLACVLAANLVWALVQDAYDTAQELHRERTLALAPPPPPVRGRGARHTHTHGDPQ